MLLVWSKISCCPPVKITPKCKGSFPYLPNHGKHNSFFLCPYVLSDLPISCQFFNLNQWEFLLTYDPSSWFQKVNEFILYTFLFEEFFLFLLKLNCVRTHVFFLWWTVLYFLGPPIAMSRLVWVTNCNIFFFNLFSFSKLLTRFKILFY